MPFSPSRSQEASFNQVNSPSVEPSSSGDGSGATMAPDVARDQVILDLRRRLEEERRHSFRLMMHLQQACIDTGRAEDDASEARRQYESLAREVVRAPGGEIAYVSAAARSRLEEAISSLTNRYIRVKNALHVARLQRQPVFIPAPSVAPAPEVRNASTGTHIRAGMRSTRRTRHEIDELDYDDYDPDEVSVIQLEMAYSALSEAYDELLAEKKAVERRLRHRSSIGLQKARRMTRRLEEELREVKRELARARMPPRVSPAEESDALSCCVCLSAPKTVLCLPCNHFVTCNACWEAWERKCPANTTFCPFCKAAVKKTLRPFMA